MKTRRTHFLHRFWAVMNERGEIWPHTVRYSRGKSTAAFLDVSYGAYGDKWKECRSWGFRLVCVQIKVIK